MYLTSTGMVCPVGLNAAAACAAMRAGLDCFEELPYADNAGEPIIGAMVPGLRHDLKREERIVELLALALLDCLANSDIEDVEKIPLLIGLAESERPGGSAQLGDRIVREVEKRLEVRFNSEFSRAISQGHASGFEALRMARDLFQDSKISACIICGVDSYMNARSLLWLDQHWRLKTEENSDGVIPGESAAAVLLRHQPKRPNLPVTRIVGLGFGHEQAHILSDDPLLGLGLTHAARIALDDAGFQMNDIDFRISDVTGEGYGFKEQTLVLGRLMRKRCEEFPIWHCSEFIGDTGAASGVCQLVIVEHAFRKNYAVGDRVLCYTSAVGGGRSVAVICRENM